MPDDKNWFGRRLRAAREAAKLSQEGLAERVDITRLTVARYESGKLKPSFERLAPIAAALSQPLWWFFTSEDEKPEPTDPGPSKALYQEILLRLTLLEAQMARHQPVLNESSPNLPAARENATLSYFGGIQEEIRQARQEGVEEGLEVLRTSIKEILEVRFRGLPEDLGANLDSIKEALRLRTLARTAATATSLDDFIESLEIA